MEYIQLTDREGSTIYFNTDNIISIRFREKHGVFINTIDGEDRAGRRDNRDCSR